MKIVISSLMGGLGNQLFQTAAGYALSLDEECSFSIPPLPNQECTRKIGYSQNILSRVPTVNGIPPCKVYREPQFSYTPLPRKFSHNMLLHGYFQSFKYFDKYWSKIKELFAPSPQDLEKLAKYNFERSLSIHIRRGDYVQLQHYHPVQSIDYYKKALELVAGKWDRVYIFSDDIPWCKSQEFFQKLNPTYVDGEPDYMCLYIMSNCSVHIIANSSFSWWGAYLSNSEKVVHPKRWFGPKGPSANMDDLIPPTLNSAGERIWVAV